MGIVRLAPALDKEHQVLVPSPYRFLGVLDRGHVTAGSNEGNGSVLLIKDGFYRPADTSHSLRGLEPLFNDTGIRRPEELGHLGCDHVGVPLAGDRHEYAAGELVLCLSE